MKLDSMKRVLGSIRFYLSADLVGFLSLSKVGDERGKLYNRR
jgi:hypothetical protein